MIDEYSFVSGSSVIAWSFLYECVLNDMLYDASLIIYPPKRCLGYGRRLQVSITNLGHIEYLYLNKGSFSLCPLSPPVPDVLKRTRNY